MKAIWINTPKRTITEVDYNGLADLQRMVGGSIEFAGRLDKDTVYVHDEGLYVYDCFFHLPGCGQELFAGPAVLVGKEIGMSSKTRDPKTELDEVTSTLTWLSRFEALLLSKRLGI